MSSPSAAQIKSALDAGQGLLRLAPTWVPRSFLMPGRRIKLHLDDIYAYGAHRGGIDERWFASTTPAANENRTPDEGLSWCVVDGKKAFTLVDAVGLEGERLVGKALWAAYKRWPVYSKYFDNMGPIPHHMHQNDEQAKLVGQQGKPESYYFPKQLNAIGNNFPYTFMGLEPGTTKEDIVRCLDRWNEGDNGILNFSKAYRLQPGTGWLIPPCVLHAPGSIVTYEPQWGSDVFGMYQSLVEGRPVPRSLLTKDFPPEKHNDNRYLVDALDWNANVNPSFKDSHYLEPVVATKGDGWVDRWVVYGKVNGKELFSAKELTVDAGATAVVKDGGASGLNTTQGSGTINGLPLQTPAMIRFGELTTDEYFISSDAATAGVTIKNTGTEELVILRYFGPDVHGAASYPPSAHTRNNDSRRFAEALQRACVMRVIAYHVVFSTYGFWLPNDPRGSNSSKVRAENIKPFGPATLATHTRQSVANKPHDRTLRLAAKKALVRPEVKLTGHQAASIGRGFAKQVGVSGFRVHACCILPQHMHLVIGRHHFEIEQVVRLLRQAGTTQLLEDKLHPFERDIKGKLPSVWGQDFRKIFVFTSEVVFDKIKYVEDNPLREGKPKQTWPFVIPYVPE